MFTDIYNLKIMKKQPTFFTLLFLLAFTSLSAQDFQEKNHSDEFIKNCIIEIFQEKADKLVFNSNSMRYTLMRNFIKHNVIVEYHPEFQGKGFESTNSLPLQNKYNSAIQRDQSYQIGVFNPLRYAISMSPNKKMMYRIADSDYIMIISPKK